MEQDLKVILSPTYEKIKDDIRACANITILYNAEVVNIEDTVYTYYFDDKPVKSFLDVVNPSTGEHNFKVVVSYKDDTAIASVNKYYSKYAINNPVNTKPITSKVANKRFYPFICKKSFPYINAQEYRVYYTNTITFRYKDIHKIRRAITQFDEYEPICIRVSHIRVDIDAKDYLVEDIEQMFEYCNANKDIVVSAQIICRNKIYIYKCKTETLINAVISTYPPHNVQIPKYELPDIIKIPIGKNESFISNIKVYKKIFIKRNIGKKYERYSKHKYVDTLYGFINRLIKVEEIVNKVYIHKSPIPLRIKTNNYYTSDIKSYFLKIDTLKGIVTLQACTKRKVTTHLKQTEAVI